MVVCCQTIIMLRHICLDLYRNSLGDAQQILVIITQLVVNIIDIIHVPNFPLNSQDMSNIFSSFYIIICILLHQAACISAVRHHVMLFSGQSVAKLGFS